MKGDEMFSDKQKSAILLALTDTIAGAGIANNWRLANAVANRFGALVGTTDWSEWWKRTQRQMIAMGNQVTLHDDGRPMCCNYDLPGFSRQGFVICPKCHAIYGYCKTCNKLSAFKLEQYGHNIGLECAECCNFTPIQRPAQKKGKAQDAAPTVGA